MKNMAVFFSLSGIVPGFCVFSRFFWFQQQCNFWDSFKMSIEMSNVLSDSLQVHFPYFFKENNTPHNAEEIPQL